MKITRHNLDQAVLAQIISQEQAVALYNFFKQLPEQSPGFNFTNVLYYLGGLIAIGAMTLFMNLGWELFGGFGIFGLSVVYGTVGLYLAYKFHLKELFIPAGICATFVICLTPLAIYGLQLGLGFWSGKEVYQNYHYIIDWRWMFMEFGTLIIGIILAWIYRYPFMVMPIAVTLWYMSMDLTSMLTGGTYDFTLKTTVSLYFGLMIIFIAIFVDIRSRFSKDYAFWLYLFGVIAFWCGLTMQYSDSEVSKFIYCLINLFMMFVGVVLIRRVFVVFGAFGVIGYIGHLAFSLFSDSMLFPFILTFIGFAIIYLGVLWQRYEHRITEKLHAFLPKNVKELLESRED